MTSMFLELPVLDSTYLLTVAYLQNVATALYA
jgi:hypothetical protein